MAVIFKIHSVLSGHKKTAYERFPIRGKAREIIRSNFAGFLWFSFAPLL
jgi:hypothetical protein